jgi:hypothetical protein
MKTKEITPIQYAEATGQTLQNVTKHLRNANPLPGVIKVKKYSRFYILIVNKSMNVNTIEKARANMLARYPSSFITS